MYRIRTVKGRYIGLTKKPIYVIKSSAGMVLCGEGEATGIAYEGEVYPLMGKTERPNGRTVILERLGQEAAYG